MSTDEHRHVALPQLVGAPAYARPARRGAETVERPFDPDALPLVVAMTDAERLDVERTAALAAEAANPAQPAKLLPRSFSLRALADRLRNARN